MEETPEAGIGYGLVRFKKTQKAKKKDRRRCSSKNQDGALWIDVTPWPSCAIKKTLPMSMSMSTWERENV